MEMVAAVVGGRELFRIIGVADGRVEIDYAVKSAARANPLIVSRFRSPSSVK